jgi:hypothetical protein
MTDTAAASSLPHHRSRRADRIDVARRDEQEPAALAAIRARQAKIDDSLPLRQSSNIPSACRGVSTIIGPGLRSTTMLRK